MCHQEPSAHIIQPQVLPHLGHIHLYWWYMDLFTDILHIDGACGSGKTQLALEFTAQAVNKFDHPMLIVQPTKLLIQQSIERLQAMAPETPIFAFTSDNHPHQVMADLLKHLTNKPNGGQVVFVTHKTFLDLPWSPCKNQWHVIIDEVFTIDFQFSINLSETWKWFLEGLHAVECDDNIYHELVCDKAVLDRATRWARNKNGDQLIERLQPLFDVLANDHWTVHVTRASWERLGYLGKAQLDVHAHLNPSVLSGFASARIMGANFTDSLLYHLWSQTGAVFRKDRKIVPHAVDPRQLGQRVDIHFFSAHAWSKSRRDKLGEKGEQGITEMAKELFGDEPFLWVANNDLGDDALPLANGTRISNISHGDNRWRSWHNIAFLSALNNNPSHFSYLDHMFGVDQVALRKARAWETAYQCILRTSLRDASSTERVQVLVPDRDLAEYLAHHMFPGSRLHSASSDLLDQAIVGDARKARGRPIKEVTLTGAERTRNSRYNARAIGVTKNTIYKAFFVTDDTSLSSLPMTISVEDDIFATQWLDQEVGNADQLRALLLKAHQLNYSTKDENLAISGAVFDPSLSQDTRKGLANIKAVWMMMLDFDGGALSPEEAGRLLKDIKHIRYNSYNNGKDGQTKFRIVIPFAKPASVQLYHHVWDLIADRITSAGYRVGKSPANLPDSGLDRSKRTANSWFYLPCRAAKGKAHTFWRENWDAPLLNPWDWTTRRASEKPEYELRAPTITATAEMIKLRRALASQRDNVEHELARGRFYDAAIRAAEEAWPTTPRGEGRHEFFRLAWMYRTAGLSDGEIDLRLRQQARLRINEVKRLSEIPGIFKSFNGYGRSSNARR